MVLCTKRKHIGGRQSLAQKDLLFFFFSEKKHIVTYSPAEEFTKPRADTSGSHKLCPKQESNAHEVCS